MAADALDISSHDIGYVEYVGPGLSRGRVLSTCVISMWSNAIRFKYMLMFPLKNLAREELYAFYATTINRTNSLRVSCYFLCQKKSAFTFVEGRSMPMYYACPEVSPTSKWLMCLETEYTSVHVGGRGRSESSEIWSCFNDSNLLKC